MRKQNLTIWNHGYLLGGLNNSTLDFTCSDYDLIHNGTLFLHEFFRGFQIQALFQLFSVLWHRHARAPVMG